MDTKNKLSVMSNNGKILRASAIIAFIGWIGFSMYGVPYPFVNLPLDKVEYIAKGHINTSNIIHFSSWIRDVRKVSNVVEEVNDAIVWMCNPSLVSIDVTGIVFLDKYDNPIICFRYQNENRGFLILSVTRTNGNYRVNGPFQKTVTGRRALIRYPLFSIFNNSAEEH